MDINNLDNPNTDEARLERAKQKKKGRTGKVFLTVIALIMIALAAFIITIKIAQPGFKLTSLIPESAYQLIDEKLFGHTTTEPETTTEKTAVTTTEPVTEPVTVPAASYLPIEEFAFNTAVQGNYMGNILAGGKVGTDLTYIYHIVDGRGIYRFEPSSEGYARIYKTDHRLSSLNLRGEYLYFTDDKDGSFYRLKKGESKPERLAENIKTAYVYDKRIYLITKDNAVSTMKTDKLQAKTLYKSGDGALELIGISLHAVFFSETDGDGEVSYLTVRLSGEEAPAHFRKSTEKDEVIAPVLENGFLYYYAQQKNGEYNLCRQKFGSDRVVTLVEGMTSLTPAVIDSNRLFYGELDGKRFKMMELNMNSRAAKVLLSARGVKGDNTLTVQHGGSYDFIIGKKSAEGNSVYAGSCIDTGSANIMQFEDGAWSY